MRLKGLANSLLGLIGSMLGSAGGIIVEFGVCLSFSYGGHNV